jgi:CheY-like chemotaxis protein
MAFSENELKVLIAEDHFPVRQMVAAVLRTKNVPIIEQAANGQQAHEMILGAYNDGAPFHMVFLDWQMPVISGIDVLKYFRARSVYANTAFIMLTAKSMQVEVMEAVRAGATSYMVKPVSHATMGKKFDEVLIWVKQMNA